MIFGSAGISSACFLTLMKPFDAEFQAAAGDQ
jgi:hypothetical protein